MSDALEYFELRKVTIPSVEPGEFRMGNAACLICSLCGDYLAGSGGPGPVICMRCVDVVKSGAARGAIKYDAAAKEEFAWVIERGDTPVSEPKYWAAGQIDAARFSAWTSNHTQAIRFARKEDAENVANRIMKGTDVRICEHGWT